MIFRSKILITKVIWRMICAHLRLLMLLGRQIRVRISRQIRIWISRQAQIPGVVQLGGRDAYGAESVGYDIRVAAELPPDPAQVVHVGALRQGWPEYKFSNWALTILDHYHCARGVSYRTHQSTFSTRYTKYIHEVCTTHFSLVSLTLPNSCKIFCHNW